MDHVLREEIINWEYWYWIDIWNFNSEIVILKEEATQELINLEYEKILDKINSIENDNQIWSI